MIRKWYPCLNGKGRSSRLVVNCSGSTDGTLRILEDLGSEFPALEWLQNSKNTGSSRLLDLFRYAADQGADHVFQTDPDSEPDTAEFDAFWELRSKNNIIIGTVSRRGDGWVRRFLHWADMRLLRHFFRVRVKDANIPFRLMSRLILENYLEIIPESCLLPNVCLAALAAAGGEDVQFREIPLTPGRSRRENPFVNLRNIFKTAALFNRLGRRFARVSVRQAELEHKLYLLSSCSLQDLLTYGLRKLGLGNPKTEVINEKSINAKNHRQGKDLKSLEHDYFHIMRRRLDIKDTVTFCEKIQWMKIYDSTAVKTRLSDKYLVKEWIAETVGPEYVIPTYGCWDDAAKIDFDALPESYMLKPNNNCGKFAKINNNSRLSDGEKEEIRAMCGKWLEDDFSLCHCELHYKDIKPLIIAEQLLPDFLIGSNEYKFLCMDGKIAAIYDFKRDPRSTERVICMDAYSRGWEKLDWTSDISLPSFGQKADPPETLREMIGLAEKLSKGFALVRVDFYDVGGKVYVGEMTFTPTAGYGEFTSLAYEIALGRKIIL